MRSTICLFILCLFTACAQMRFVGIETFNPAEITYPGHVRNVLIVNNAAPQRPDSGYEYKINGVLQDTCKAYADSALFDACRALGEAIVETGFFDDVLLFEENTRKDKSGLLDVKLTREEVQALCEETGADAVISIDRLLFKMKKEVSVFPEGYVYGTIDMEMTGIVRSYLPFKETPHATVLIADSLFWGEEAFDIKILNQLLPLPDNALRIAGAYIGNKTHPVFVPHWDRESRWFFTGAGAHWKKASVYAAKNKWGEALEEWRYIYNNSSNWKNKAKSASNTALAYELTGDLDKALLLATEACELYEKNAGESNPYTYYQYLYKETLTKRIESEKKLTLQIN
ncbi:MAG: tetratricopeptide repeat protein [Tannerellaceae bacterium]|nr:tetratricopeptide repeat protein [Tannerellaceae bacterium]